MKAQGTGRRPAWAGVLAIVALSFVLLPNRDDAKGTKPEETKAELKALADARIKLARQALADLEAQRRNSTISRNDRGFLLWLRRIAETRREMGGARADVISDLKAYRDQARQVQAAALASQNVGSVSLSAAREAEYQALEAESWLAEANAK